MSGILHNRMGIKISKVSKNGSTEEWLKIISLEPELPGFKS